MAFKRRRIEGLTSAAPKELGSVGLGAAYGRVFGMVARNYASSAKAAAGTDTAGRIELKDANGDIFFLDAADRDYATAEVTLAFHMDATVTGLGITPVDLTGAAITGAAGDNPTAEMPVVKGPITVTARNFGTVTDYLSVDLLVEV
jgi:hypothetical protein